jgi:putative tryptophan/tyrosine transport system substrate-binding protein
MSEVIGIGAAPRRKEELRFLTGRGNYVADIERPEMVAALSVHHRVPTIHQYREFAAAGGLMSYGTDTSDPLHQVGVYAARTLKGEKPGDLPIQRSTRFELVINLSTAKALGLQIPDKLLALADEVIE